MSVVFLICVLDVLFMRDLVIVIMYFSFRSYIIDMN